MPRALASDYEEFKGRLRDCMRLAGSENKLATKAEIAQSTIRGYSMGVEPRRDDLLKIARAVGVSPAWLLAGEGPMHPRTSDSGDGAPEPPPVSREELLAYAVAKVFDVPVDRVGTRLIGSKEFGQLDQAASQARDLAPIRLISRQSNGGETLVGNFSRRIFSEHLPDVPADGLAIFEMIPTDHEFFNEEREWAVVDTTERQALISGKYCVEVAGSLFITRIEVVDEKKQFVVFLTDPAGEEMKVTCDSLDDFRRNGRIIGRVVKKLRMFPPEPPPD